MSPTACAEFTEVDTLNNMVRCLAKHASILSKQSQVIELLSSDSEAGTPVKYKLLENMPKKI